jgi:alkanesulfonate monooxygenase SsuD/methylene tetrahydromethanopterin reductase-like flavin-dependent oxidoreductase (luciferase family)
MSPSRPAAGRPLIDVVLNTVDTSTRELAAAAAAAEQGGFAGVWCYDHLSGAVLGGRRCVEVWTALSVTAAATSDVVIGPLVLNASVRHPAHIATAAASLQELCDGRLQLGLGAGAGPESPYSGELAMFGFPVLDAATRRARVRDVAGYLRALWAAATSYRGEHYGFEGVNGIELPRKPVPLLVAANGPRMAELAGEVADALNMHDWQDDLEGLVELARAAAARRGVELDVTVEGPFEDAWLDRSSRLHERLAAIGVSRVMVRWDSSLGLASLAGAARCLSA